METDKLICMPVLALRGIVVFPHTLMHFDVERKKSINSVNIAMDGSRRIFLVLQKDILVEDPTPEDLCSVGCVAAIHQVLKLSDDIMRVFVKVEKRAVATNIVNGSKYIYGDISYREDKPYRISAEQKEGLLRSCVKLFDEYVAEAPGVSQDIILNVHSINDLSELADYVGLNMTLPDEDKQALLDELHPVKRMTMLLGMMKSEIELIKIEEEINQKVHEQLDENQREYVLREKMRTISEELDGDDSPTAEVDAYVQKIDELVCSEEVREKLVKEANRLLKLPAGSHDVGVIRGYLDTCLELPWDKVTKDSTDIKKAEKILNRDHYGLEKVKERILEYMAARILNPDLKGQIICLVGPPGTGKTSIAKSFAEAMGKKFVRISLGGIHDESEIRGHRKTYIGAMPGRIADALKRAGSANPLMLLDEIDKLGADYKGDPSAALLEALDSEQNFDFRDHYIELPLDLSKVFFMTTANSLDTIPAPLLDRMDVISLVSYTSEEKFNIAKRHLIPKQAKRHGLNYKNFKLTDGALREIISSYVREAGVRTLERTVASVCRKSAKLIAEGECKKVTVGIDLLHDMLKTPKYKNDKSSLTDEIGVTNGLAWTAVGGELLKIEAAILPGSGKIITTGSLGDVMKESATLAVSYIRSKSDEWNIDKDFYKKYDIHIHAPEGAVPKDGPSAGVTITTSLLSALLSVPVNGKVAMTGEITLTGKVLPIGGLREKTMAAYNNGIKTVVIPSQNRADLENAEQVVKDNIEFVFADKIDDVLKVALKNYNTVGERRDYSIVMDNSDRAGKATLSI